MTARIGRERSALRCRLTVTLALLMVAMAVPVGASAEVSVNVNIGPPPPPFVVAAPPALVVVPGTPVYYAPAVSYNYFFYGGRYYTHHNGAWFLAKGHGGPWVFVAPAYVPGPLLGVPVHYYKIPPGHMKKGGPPEWAGHGRGHRKWKDD